MFDLPVHEVTVSSAPTLVSGLRQANQTILHTSASSLLNALPRKAQTGPSSLNVVENITANANQTETLLPNGPFQLLKPLNLADITQSLEKILEQSLEDISSPAPLVNLGKVATPDEPTAETSASSLVIATSAENTERQKTISTTTLPGKTERDSKPLPGLPREAWRQCVDVPYEATDEVTTLQVFRQGDLIGELDTLAGIESVLDSLQALLGNETVKPDEITPVLEGDQPAIRLNNDVSLHVLHQQPDEESAGTDEQSTTLGKQWTAIVWSDQLRQKMGADPLDAGTIQVMLKELQPSGQQLNGTASWYGPYFHGRLTANGEIFDQNLLTAAHKTLPFNTILQVRNLKNNRTVVVRINDRGPYIGERSLDLSKAAAQCLGSETIGVVPYEAIFLEEPTPTAPAAE